LIRATLGTWLNYSTTLLFQVLFALRFGTDNAASAYVVAFAVVAGLSGLFVSTAQSVVAGRLLAEDGSLRTGPLRLMAVIIAAAGVISLGLAAAATPAGQLLSRVSGYPANLSSQLAVLSSLALFLQVLAGGAGSIALVRGRRLLPAVAPAFPTLLGGAGLALVANIDVREVLVLFVVGSCIQCITLVLAAAERVRLKAASVPHLAPTTAAVLVSFVLLALLFPFERVMSGLHASQEAADYDYAIRSLRAIQQLILGGAILASLGDWSALNSGRSRDQLSQSLVFAIVLVTLVLVLAASIAVVAGHSIVALVYERGRFLATDSDEVTKILLVALPGFCGEGVNLVLTSALAGARQNIALALLGSGNFATRVVLTVALAPEFGAIGVAAGYSITNVILLAPVFYLVSKRLLDPGFHARKFRPAVAVGFGTLMSALILASAAAGLPALLRGFTVLIVCALLWLGFRPLRGLIPVHK
jgi:peptidoglycan biosynthesis protein MviN/MurJ (putative lipid II flippase)